MTHVDLLDAFREEAFRHGLNIPAVVADGRLHRFASDPQKQSDKAGWYVYHGDGIPSAAFGCWRSGINETWCSVSDRDMTLDQREEHRRRVEQAKAASAAELEVVRAACRERSGRIWDAAPPAVDHPYLRAKGVKPHGVRLHGDILLVPVRGVDGILHGLQKIDSTGRKLFEAGTRKTGAMHIVGFPNQADHLLVCEGYATGASLHGATGLPVVVAFDAGNLSSASRAIRQAYPNHRITLCCDDDHLTPGNPGRTSAEEAARAIGGTVAIPVFPTSRGEKDTDFNDLLRLVGEEEVKRQVDAAVMPPFVQAPVDQAEVDMVRAEEGSASTDGDALGPVLDYGAPVPTAQAFADACFKTPDGVRTIHHAGGALYAWTGTHYPEAPEEGITARLYDFLSGALVRAKARKGDRLDPYQPNRERTGNILHALRHAVCHVHGGINAPAWLDRGADDPDPREIVALQNGLLHVPTGDLLPHSPRFFTPNALPFAYDPEAIAPNWERFLDDLFDEDEEARACLQDLFGYLLTPDTRQQKIFMLVGPKRSGKGTITKTLRSLLGADNVTHPSFGSLAGSFGLAPLVGKTLAVCEDARLGRGTDQASIAERLLSVSGEDPQTVERKHRDAVSLRLPVRFLLVSNELPAIVDSSGALASRFVVITLSRSFLDHEDLGLFDRLALELPGIFRWALEGFKRLRDRGRFSVPKSSQDAVRELHDLGSPVSAFLRERCDVRPGATVRCADLFTEWKKWCEEEGRDHPGTAMSFSRHLRAAVTGIETVHLGSDRSRHFNGVRIVSDWERTTA